MSLIHFAGLCKSVLYSTAALIPTLFYLKMLFRVMMGEKLDLRHPKTYNEKIQWLKIHDRKGLYTSLVDKVTAKSYVAKMTGDESLVIKTLGVWKHFDDIDFDTLPDSFVLKANNSGGNRGVVICEDKSSFDRVSARRKLERALHRNLYWRYREWPYKNIPPAILAEEYIGKVDVDFNEVKLVCFNGRMNYAVVCLDRQSDKGTTYDFYDRNWNLLPFTYGKKDHNSGTPVPRPAHFDRMIEIAEKLSAGVHLMRVDFYDNPQRLRFGEMTFYDGSGFKLFHPGKWDGIIGSWLDIEEHGENAKGIIA